MIVTTLRSATTVSGPEGIAREWRSLARRGMLFSECESVDHLVLHPGAELTTRPPARVATVWYVIRGSCRLLGPDGSVRHRLGDNDLALVPPGVEVKLSSTGTTHLLAIVTLPDTVARSLPPRLPCMEFPADEPLGRDVVR